jgi:hypothetical protein
MSARNDSAGFGRALGAAFALSVCGAAVLAALAPFLGAGTALRAVVALLGLAYMLYVLARSGERVGRVTTIACWLVAASATWFLHPSLAGYVLVHVALVWLVRSLYCYAGLLPAAADLALGALGTAFAVWAARHSGSAWLAFWCFFLVQAFHVLIPAAFPERRAEAAREPDDGFARAHRAAEAALRRIATAR